MKGGRDRSAATTSQDKRKPQTNLLLILPRSRLRRRRRRRRHAFRRSFERNFISLSMKTKLGPNPLKDASHELHLMYAAAVEGWSEEN